MVTFKERAEELAKACRRVKNNNVYETLSKEYAISKRLAGDRFKSMFGIPVRDYITKNIEPTKEELVDMIIKTDNFSELYVLSDFNDAAHLASLLKKYFGQSNLQKLKSRFLFKIPITDYAVSREDNMSILISQYLGDGHIERKGGFKIEHGEKQYDYLKFKIGLLNKAFPMTGGLEKIRKRNINDKRTGKQYTSFTYRTGEVLKSQIKIILERTLQENINNMTPLGICLYYMDNGYLSISKEYRTVELSFSTIDEVKRKYLIEYFETYGFRFNNNKKAISLNKRNDIIKFIYNFIKPFEYMLPKNMKYKYDYKDIVGLIH